MTSEAANRSRIRRAAHAITTATHLEGKVLLGLAGAALGVLIFVKLAGFVVSGDSHSFDNWLVRSLRRADDPANPIGPPWLHIAAVDATSLGSAFVLSVVIAIVCGFLWMQKMRHAMWLALIATGTGQVLSRLLKGAFGRERPSVVPHLTEFQNSSFPSGHSMMSAVVYLTLGILAAQFVRERRLRFYFLGVAFFLTILVGLSRIYLGVHYPTDVLAGWTAGLVWALICWSVARTLQRRGAVEPPAGVAAEAGDS